MLDSIMRAAKRSICTEYCTKSTALVPQGSSICRVLWELAPSNSGVERKKVLEKATRFFEVCSEWAATDAC